MRRAKRLAPTRLEGVALIVVGVVSGDVKSGRQFKYCTVDGKCSMLRRWAWQANVVVKCQVYGLENYVY